MNNKDLFILLQTEDPLDSHLSDLNSCNDSIYCQSIILNNFKDHHLKERIGKYTSTDFVRRKSREVENCTSCDRIIEINDGISLQLEGIDAGNHHKNIDKRFRSHSRGLINIQTQIPYISKDCKQSNQLNSVPLPAVAPSYIDLESANADHSDCNLSDYMTSCSTLEYKKEFDVGYRARQCESQPKQATMRLESKANLDDIITKAGGEILKSPEVATSEATRRILAVCREIFIAIIGAQLVYVLTSLLFGNIASAIIVSLLAIQSTFCHCDGRPVAYVVNGILSLAIGSLVLVALLRDVSGLEPFKTEPVLRSLSYVYVPLCLVFTVLSFFLACSFRRLHRRERAAIINATNRLLGNKYHINDKSFTLNKS